ncbi:hypothetical protein FRACYDRAFT_251569 [Fragilariopsis cylindrus CCMP1102]|uniref:Uncharacterized protein n=1 Tax=Fragilariopsis cylindrus CCMP1102 TaxID=635003 RepID=A0A1E7EMQ9_9STRA|nr:hypothetical protein FRACYDRAFT_251569 [Fragilariopsis cylindrus CCMP1102]|eukprot:OEU07220.1 hypothetical protein FRACYDRAFT_251569 [Fragilariopsis cylindrus CCMP1102]
MHAMINDNAVRSSNCYDYNKCATTRSEYNDRLTTLLSRNEELEVELQNEQRLNQRYQIKTNVQNILIEELITSHSPTIDDNDSDDRNKDNNLLLIKNAKRVAALSMEIEEMKQQQQQQQQRGNDNEHESPGPLNLNLNHDDNDKGVDDDDEDDTTRSLSSDDESNDELLLLLEKERADYFEKKNESLQRSVDTFKCKNSERELRHAISFRTMRNQIESLEVQLKRNSSLPLQLQEIQEEQEARRNQFEVENIKLKLQLTHYRRHDETININETKLLQQQQ